MEMHRCLAPMHTVRIARNIEQFRPFWYEEPVLAENVDALAAVKREIPCLRKNSSARSLISVL